MRLLDLFSGIGGFSLAARWAGGFETIGFCEIDSYCQKVLQKNFPGVPIHDDIKTLQGDEFGPVDIITGGFPCQPFSFAGKRKGKADDRDLWPQMFRIIKNAKPRWVIGENVNGFINVGFERTALNLEAEGYEVQALVIPACAVKAPHRRDRLWILAHRRERGRSAESKLKQKDRSPILDSSGPGDVGNTTSEGLLSGPFSRIHCKEEGRRPWDEESKRRSDVMADADSIKSERKRINRKLGGAASAEHGEEDKRERPGHATRYCGSHLANPESRRWQQGNALSAGPCEGAFIPKEWCRFPDGSFLLNPERNWEIEPDVGRVAHGIPARVDRLKGLGNAIVPQVAFQILKGIKEIEEQNEHT